MSKKNITYNDFKKYIKDKDTAVTYYITRYLDMTQSLFRYEGLPDTIPASVLEEILQTNGNVFFTKVNNNYYIFTGAAGGEVDEYYRPTLYTVANPALNLTQSYKIGIDGVLIKNDTEMQGLLPIIGKYAVLLTDGVISLNTASILCRINMLISAGDDKTKAAADLFLQKIENGDYSVIAENSFLQGIRMQTAPTNNSVYISQLIELVQYYKASLLNELGLNANYNMKRERLNSDEVALNIDALLPFVDNMLSERRKGLAAVNDMYGLNITVDLASAWKATHEENEKETENADTITDEAEPTATPRNEIFEAEEEDTEAEEEDTEAEKEDTEAEKEDTEAEKEDTEEKEEEKQ